MRSQRLHIAYRGIAENYDIRLDDYRLPQGNPKAERSTSYPAGRPSLALLRLLPNWLGSCGQERTSPDLPAC